MSGHKPTLNFVHVYVCDFIKSDELIWMEFGMLLTLSVVNLILISSDSINFKVSTAYQILSNSIDNWRKFGSLTHLRPWITVKVI